MKQTLYAAALGLLGLALTTTSASAQTHKRTCASVEVLQQQLAADPGMAARMAAINNQAVMYAAKHAGEAQRSTVAVSVTIPVVVHVLYSTAAENISDAQIQSQIAVLNEDYHKLNSDYTKTPSAFAGLVADVGIQFVLAKRDPNGAATTGIERKSSTTTSWGTADNIKKTTTGGLNAWNSSQYLNLWVGTIGGGILGYAQFPGGAAATDGVVISPVYFGRTGTVTSPYNLGRTASHEVGHWLNLNHIWGDDSGACTGTDNVSDTPNQGSENYGKPVFPHVSCSNGPNGDMFMNYMDYVDDNAMFMFSNGQSSRMNALFASGGARVGLLTSLGGTAPSGGTCPTTGGLTAGSITNTSATVSWAAASGAVSYNLQYRVSGASAWTTLSQAGTSASLTGLTAGATYQFQVQTVCSGSTGAYSAIASFTTTGGTTPPSGIYCASKGTSVAYEYIAQVSLGSISRTSGADGGYYDGTAGATTSLAQGSAQSITYKAGFVATSYTEYVKVYIDYNQNGVFTDAGETVVSGTVSSATAAAGSFTVPATAKTGATRMRVVLSDNAATTSCGTYSYGETEDYTVNITTGTGTPPPAAYCASKGASVAYEYIDLVQLGTINRTSGADGGYYDGTAGTTASLPVGVAQTISFSAGFVGTAYSEYFKVYIDYNHNGVFTDAGELVASAAASSVATTRTATFTVPATVYSGATRMRVVMSDNSATTSCGSYSYGETEDYTISISGGVAAKDGNARSGNGLGEQYTLYPNPTSGVLHIARPAGTDQGAEFSVRVYDLRGAEVSNLKMVDGQLDVSALRAGTYLLNVSDAAGTSHQRFVKE